jgi:hypothetical protein
VLSVLGLLVENDTLSSKGNHHIYKLIPLDLAIFVLIVFVEQFLDLSSRIFSSSLDHTNVHHEVLELTGVHVGITIGIITLKAIDEQLSIWTRQFV